MRVEQHVVLVLEFAGADVLIAHVVVGNVALIERVARPAGGVGVGPRHPQAQARHRRFVPCHLGQRAGADEIQPELRRDLAQAAARPACAAQNPGARRIVGAAGVKARSAIATRKFASA